jgi:hypothetical protein
MRGHGSTHAPRSSNPLTPMCSAAMKTSAYAEPATAHVVVAAIREPILSLHPLLAFPLFRGTQFSEQRRYWIKAWSSMSGQSVQWPVRMRY